MPESLYFKKAVLNSQAASGVHEISLCWFPFITKRIARTAASGQLCRATFEVNAISQSVRKTAIQIL